MRTALFAYTCGPHRGSEPGVGWAWMRMLAGLGEVHVFTRSPTRIAAHAAALPEAGRITLHHVRPPRPHPVARGRRFFRLRYLMWLGEARRQALKVGVPFDLAWHATFANVWMGTTAGRLGAPMILGPVGGGAGTPWRLAGGLGPRGLGFELRRNTARALARWLNPRARSAWRRASVILVTNPETREWLPRRYRPKVRLLPNTTVEHVRPARAREGRTALFVGRLQAWKGVWLAIRAVALAPGWRLEVCGGGPDERRLRRVAERLGVADRVLFRGWTDHEDVRRLMREEADVLLIPSLHDDGPTVAAEALSEGLPIVCLDRGGPPVVGGPAATSVAVQGGTRRTARALADVLIHRRFPPPAAVARRAAELQRDQMAQEIQRLSDEVLSSLRRSPSGKPG